MIKDDSYWMKKALKLAQKAQAKGDVPIGALLVREDTGEVLARGYNKKEAHTDPTLHAEILVIQKAGKKTKNWRLSDLSLFVTLEPCLMCAGALVQARIRRVVFGTFDPKAGALGSLYSVHTDPRLNHRFGATCLPEGEVRHQCREILRDFFRQKRTKNSKLN